MKKRNIFTLSSIVILSFLFVACGGAQHHEEHDNNAAKEVAEATYACPMHPEITGKKGDRCSKCGMYLEEIKPEVATDSTSQEEE